jgi:hypothetical protein
VIRRFTVASIVVLALLIVTARAIGSTNKPPALAILDPGDCPQPCWHGIRPGVTTSGQALALLEADSTLIKGTGIPDQIHFPFWYRISQKAWVLSIWINAHAPNVPVYRITHWLPHEALQLGDIINFLGTPVAITHCSEMSIPQAAISEKSWGAFLIFKGNIWATVYKPSRVNHHRLTPDMTVIGLYYYPADQLELVPSPPLWSDFTQWATSAAGCSPASPPRE